ncbi:MAG: NAD(P)/FAD-dependent oxidoreductase [Spirochaetales bacterium]|uniref:NADH:ubiquinone reductase (non-electrogenic) n=1 Tax=Candidatus Thalassospirochaeta sargassi TaxID=3119039 RepID=A0AAJ1ICZ0_9SPIO|nr:NAD(P)/FAD-dependent oxidoreductase [Spirochaetales bacterium]
MDTKRLVILGGGYAGIEAAKTLYKKYKKNDKVEITLIDKNTYHTLMTELHEVAGSRVEPDSVMVSYQRIFSGTNINLVTDVITGIDFETRKLKSDKAEYDYDYLVLGTGGAPEFFDIEGVQENSFSLWSLEDAMRIREHFEERFRLAANEPDESLKAQMLTFVVAGAGFTGIELIGEFIERRDVLCAKYHIPVKDVRMVVVEALDSVLPIIEEPLRKKAVKYLKKKGAEIILNARITGAAEGKILLADGSEIKTDTFIWTCGIHGSEFTSKINLTKGHTARGECSIASAEGIHGMCGCRFDEDERYVVGKRGRILVNEYMQTDDYENVYAVGDNLWFVEKEKVLPQIVETALQTGETAAENIIAEIEGNDKKAFESNYHGFMVSIGGKYAVSNAGGMKTSGFMAMAMKHLVNLHYLFGVAGINAIWGYLKHEFFDMKDRRTFIGGHLSWKIQGWWAVPLRVWLGLMWVFEGINKIGEGWFNFSAGSKSGWMFSSGVLQKGVKPAADAYSAASGAGETAVEAAGHADMTAVFDSAMPNPQHGSDAVSAASDYAAGAAEAVVEAAADTVSAASDSAAVAVEAAADAVSAASDYAADAAGAAADTAGQVFGKIWDLGNNIIPYESGFVTWFRETFMDGIAAYIHYPVFQVMIVLVEIGIGLALMGGCFTFIAAGVSIIMCLVFTFSGMFAWDQAWFVFAAFLLLGGAGRSLGLDHWIMPAIKRWWNGTKLARRTHWFVGEPKTRNK